jgi:hypothetical protein
MNTKLSDIERRIKRYWFEDGIGELAGGGMFLLIGLYFAGGEWLPSGSPARALLSASLVFLLVGGAFATRWLVNSIKTRLTYPRTGYVEYYPSVKETRSRRLWTVTIAIVVSMSLVIFGRFVGSFNWLPGFTGLVVGFAFIMKRARAEGLGRFYYLAAFSILIGLALSFSGLSMEYSLGAFYGLIGIAVIVSGGLTLARYLHENPIHADGRDE